MGGIMPEKVEQIMFVSDFDGTEQTYLIQKPASSQYSGIVIFLHGATNHQQQGFNREIFNGTIGKLIDDVMEKNYIYVCPEYRGDSWMNQAAEHDLVFIIEQLVKNFRTSKILLMGGSMGGTSSLMFSTRNPQLVSSCLALCPATEMKELYYYWHGTERDFLAKTIENAYGGTPEKNAAQYKERSSIYLVEKLCSMPVAIIHGDSDIVIPVEHSRRFIEKSRKAGVKIYYHEIKDGNHDSPIMDFAIVKKAIDWLEFAITGQ